MTLLVFQEIAPYEFDLDDVLAYIAHSMLLVIFLLAAYTRFANIITNISSVNVVAEEEVYLWKDLVVVASFLVLFVLLFAIGCSIYEGMDIVKRRSEMNMKQLPEITKNSDFAVGDFVNLRNLIGSASVYNSRQGKIIRVIPGANRQRYETLYIVSVDNDRVVAMFGNCKLSSKKENIDGQPKSAFRAQWIASQDNWSNPREDDEKRDVGKSDDRRLGEVQTKLELTEKQIVKAKADIPNLKTRISELRSALEKADKKQAKATRKLETVQTAADDSDSDSSDHHRQLVRMHSNAVDKARGKYESCQAEISSAQASLDDTISRLATLRKQRDELRELAARIAEEIAKSQPWVCKRCQHKCQYEFCPRCATSRDGATAVAGLTPRLDAMEASLDAKIAAKVMKRLHSMYSTRSGGNQEASGDSTLVDIRVDDAGPVGEQSENNDRQPLIIRRLLGTDSSGTVGLQETDLEREDRIKRLTQQKLDEYKKAGAIVNRAAEANSPLPESPPIGIPTGADTFPSLPEAKPCE